MGVGVGLVERVDAVCVCKRQVFGGAVCFGGGEGCEESCLSIFFLRREDTERGLQKDPSSLSCDT